MHRPGISAQFTGLLASAILISGMAVQATPILAASHVPLQVPISARGSVAVDSGGSGTINVRALAGHAAKSPTAGAVAGLAALNQVESKAAVAAAKSQAKVGPNVVGPPDPDPMTDSGNPAASTPVAAAGQSEPGSGTVEPPNAGIAVGPDSLIQSDTNSLEFASRTGASIETIGLATFFKLATTRTGYTTFNAEPRVMFDTTHQRWIVSELSWDCATHTFPKDLAAFGHGYIDYAISNTADPLGTWTDSYFVFHDLLPDLPAFGTSTDKLAFGARMFSMGAGGSPTTPGCISASQVGSHGIVTDWASLAGSFNPVTLPYVSTAYPDLDALRVATQEPIIDADVRMIGQANGTGSGEADGDVIYLDMTGSAAHTTIVISEFDLTVDGIIPGFGLPAAPTQPGGTLTTAISGAPDSVVYANHVLAFAATYPCIPAGDTLTRDCVRVTSLANPLAAAEPTRHADVLLGTDALDSSFGSIGFTGTGILHAVYTESSATVDPGSVTQYQAPTDAATAWSAPATLTAGTGAYAGTGWGAAPIVATDPQDPNAAWVGDPAAVLAGTWATTIHELVVGGGGAGYFPITPVRVLDSRSPSGAPVGFSGVISANVPRTFAVAGAHGIPSSAIAITGNLTVTNQTKAGYIALTPTPTATPSSATLNFPTGDNRGNNTTIALAPDGSLAVVYKAASGAHANVILDVTGYFSTTGVGQRYTPLAGPVRILNTSPGTSLGQTTFAANVPKTFLVADGVIIPSGAAAITANLAILHQTHAGYVTLTPTPDPNPATSTINFPLGDTRANGLTIPINPLDGTVAAVFKASAGTVDLVLDVTGYYSADPSGLLFHPLNPGRRIDTRLPAGLDGFGNGLTGAQGTTPRSVAIAGHDGLPADAAAITGNLSITAQTAAGYVSVTTSSVLHPTTSTINFPLADTRGNGITVPLGTGGNAGKLWFVYQHTAGKHVQLILDITGYFE